MEHYRKGIRVTSQTNHPGFHGTELPIYVTGRTKINRDQEFIFQVMVRQYLDNNYERILDQELKKAEKRAEK